MSAENPKPRKATSRPRKRVERLYPRDGTGREHVSSVADRLCAGRGLPANGDWKPSRPRARVNWIRWQAICADALTRAWSFLHAKYKSSTTKRLHVSETISLGEKRFVAIVNVEGREFLIGGGVSGMSLLAQLGAAPRNSCDLGQGIGDSGVIL